jgi:hypothetical protein
MNPRKLFLVALGGAYLAALPGVPMAAEHPGRAVQSQEHPGRAVEKAEPRITADAVKMAIRAHVKANTIAGVFSLPDPASNKTWKLTLDKIHDPVRQFEKDGRTVYFACSDFKSTDSPDVLDVDFWMVPQAGKLTVVDTKIHKLNGQPRYTYEGVTIKEIK